MKKALLSLVAFFAFSALATAQQEVQERLDQQPVPVTEAEVQQDAKVAQLEHEKNIQAEKKQLQEIKEQQQKKQLATTSLNNKASVKPGQQ